MQIEMHTQLYVIQFIHYLTTTYPDIRYKTMCANDEHKWFIIPKYPTDAFKY